MNSINKIVLIDVPDRKESRLRPMRRPRFKKIRHPYYPPMRDLEEYRLPRDVFQRNGKNNVRITQNNGK